MARRRLPAGRPDLPRLLGVLAAAVLVIALVVTGRLLGGGEPARPSPPTGPTTGTRAAVDTPYRVEGGFRCPLARLVLAMSDRRSYPPGHPATPPPDATAVACFRTAADAVAAGYPEAPLPAGAVEVGGVYLTPTSPALRARCRRAAGRLGFAVPCPGLLPNSAPHTGPPRLCDTPQFGCARGQPFVLRQDGFQVPPGYLVTGSQPLFGGSLTIMAWPGSRLPAGADPESCAAPGRPVDVRQVAGARALLVRCPEGSPLADVGVFESQTLLAWSRSGRYTIVGVGGWSTVNEGLAVAVAEHLEPVEPGR